MCIFYLIVSEYANDAYAKLNECVCVCVPSISHRNTTIRSNTCLHIINKERFDVNHHYTTWLNVYFANESISKWSYRFLASHPQSFRWLMDQSNERFKRAWIIHVLCDDRPNSEHWQKHVYPEPRICVRMMKVNSIWMSGASYNHNRWENLFINEPHSWFIQTNAPMDCLNMRMQRICDDQWIRMIDPGFDSFGIRTR